jgi:branched-chain amino acid transport system ATP-binding protein
MLQVEQIGVRFGGIQALRDLSFTAEPGNVTGLIGPNGAGKTTSFNVVTGLQRPSSGCVRFGGNDITRMSPQRRAKRGIARTYQRLEVFGSLSVRDNVQVAVEVHGGWKARRGARARTAELIEQVGLEEVADVTADLLPTGMARLVEVARALAGRPQLVLFDEVSSGLSVPETERLGELLTSLGRDGVAVLLVEHDMDLVMSVCTQLFVLDFGELICQGSPAVVQADPRVQEAYLGTQPSTTTDTEPAKPATLPATSPLGREATA